MNISGRDCIRSFGVFEVDLSAGALRKSGFKLRLPEQSFQVLALLLQRPGDVISRDEMRRRLWPAGTHVDFAHGVNKAVNRLRQALGDSASHPRFVETLRGRGYRFLSPLSSPDSLRENQTPGKLRLAVLPFENVSSGPKPDLFAGEFTEELTVQLGQIHPEWLGVIGRGSVVMYRNSGKALADVAAELNLSHVVEGSVRRCGERVRISAQLVEVFDQTQLWAENYDRSLGDAFAVQSEVAQIISHVVAFKLLAKIEDRRTASRAQFQKSVSTLEKQESDRNPLRPV
jgi:TolB-like protein